MNKRFGRRSHHLREWSLRSRVMRCQTTWPGPFVGRLGPLSRPDKPPGKPSNRPPGAAGDGTMVPSGEGARLLRCRIRRSSMPANDPGQGWMADRGAARQGLTLLEVVLAVAILGFSIAAISQLMWIGYRSAVEARARTEMVMLCDTKMAEIAAGVLPLASVGGQPIPEAPQWLYFVEVQNSQLLGLLTVTVTVAQSPEVAASPITMSIVRFMPDPSYDPSEEQGVRR